MKFFILLALVINIQVFAHGENKLGPNNGYIRMPGAFHTELVPNQDGSISVFLLNVNNQDPTVENSKIELYYASIAKSIKVKYNCEKMTNFFKCIASEKIDLNEGILILNSSRKNNIGTHVKYKLPLSLESF